MKKIQFLSNTLLLTTLFLALTSCQNQKKTVYKPIQKYSTSSYCIEDNIGQEYIISESMSEILDNFNKHSVDKVVNTILDSSALSIAAQTNSIEECAIVFKKGEIKFNSLLNKYRSELAKKGGGKLSSDIGIAQIQKDITYMWRDDQSARITLVSLTTKEKEGANYWSNTLAKVHTYLTDNKSISYLELLLEKYDWVDNHRFGRAVSKHAWIMIQHADQRPKLQAKVLERMEPYLVTNKIQPSNYAYLWDRVAVNTDKKQRYGTQPTWECIDGKMELMPLENPESVNQRRAEIGMGSVEKSLDEMNSQTCGN